MNPWKEYALIGGLFLLIGFGVFIKQHVERQAFLREFTNIYIDTELKGRIINFVNGEAYGLRGGEEIPMFRLDDGKSYTLLVCQGFRKEMHRAIVKGAYLYKMQGDPKLKVTQIVRGDSIHYYLEVPKGRFERCDGD